MRTVLLILFLPGLGHSCNSSREEQRKPATTRPEVEYGIAFIVLVDEVYDNYDIFTMNLDGSERKNITNNKDL